MYVIYNYKTKERKAFIRFDELRDFYRHLSIAQMSDWSGWRFVD